MKTDTKWIVFMFVITFITAMVIGGASNTIIEQMSLPFAIITLIGIIAIGILFDIIGMAVATCDEAPFHAKASKKSKGAKQTIKLLRAKDKTTNFCNDLMGDMCGIVSGSASALIAVRISSTLQYDVVIVSLVMSAIVASVTVGGKAFGKRIGIDKAEKIMGTVGKIISVFVPEKPKSKKKKK